MEMSKDTLHALYEIIVQCICFFRVDNDCANDFVGEDGDYNDEGDNNLVAYNIVGVYNVDDIPGKKGSKSIIVIVFVGVFCYDGGILEKKCNVLSEWTQKVKKN